jgi:hypothetical protein
MMSTALLEYSFSCVPKRMGMGATGCLEMLQQHGDHRSGASSGA